MSGVSYCGIPVFLFIGRDDLVPQSLQFRVLWQLYRHCADLTAHRAPRSHVESRRDPVQRHRRLRLDHLRDQRLPPVLGQHLQEGDGEQIVTNLWFFMPPKESCYFGCGGLLGFNIHASPGVR